MNREEINEALKIIKEPITVNSIEYKYFDQENYEKLLRVYENCRWFIDNYEQVLQNIENLQQELQRKDSNWNELKTYIQMNINATCNMNNDNYNEGRYNASCDILDKINELEGDNK